jgi:hypothetical protein
MSKFLCKGITSAEYLLNKIILSLNFLKTSSPLSVKIIAILNLSR